MNLLVGCFLMPSLIVRWSCLSWISQTPFRPQDEGADEKNFSRTNSSSLSSSLPVLDDTVTIYTYLYYFNLF